MYYVLRLLKSKYGKLIEFSFDTIEIAKTIGVERDKKFMNYALQEIKGMEINLVNVIDGTEYEEEFDALIDKIQEAIGVCGINTSKNIEKDKANILLIHNFIFYKN